MSIVTKKVTMSNKAWCVILKATLIHHSLVDDDDEQLGPLEEAVSALAEAETIAVTDTYANPVVDQWRRDATAEGRS